MESLLDVYSCKKALERIGLTSRTYEVACKVAELMGDDNRVNVELIHREIYGVPDLNTTQSANAQLNRLLKTINEAARRSKVSFEACITPNKKAGAKNRWVWFEGPLLAAPETLAEDLDGIEPGLLVEQRAIPWRERPVVVLMTFNEHETAAVLERFCPGLQPKCETQSGVVYYRLGVHNGAEVILAISRQGVSEAQSAAGDACAVWHPDWLIGVGIAFGVNPEKQDMGDVLVATFSQGYERQRVEPDGTVTSKDDPQSSSRLLVGRIKQLDHMKRASGGSAIGWPTLHFGGLLCGDKLVDNIDYRDSLLKLYPNNIIGGEMEGLGLAISAGEPQYRAEWTVVKAISDWADGKKNTTCKERNQKQAAKNAAHVVYETLRHAPLPDTFNRNGSFALPAASDVEGGSFNLPVTRKEELEDVPYYVEGLRGAFTSLKKTEEPSSDLFSKDRGVDVIEALIEWATRDESKPLFALLGEYGMGKTVTCQRFTEELEERRGEDPAVPIPLYFNLRSLTGLDQRVPTVEDVMLECAQRDWILPAREGAVSLAMINRYIEQGAVVIFDGLDEVLVKLKSKDGPVFTRGLLSLLDKVRVRQKETGGSALKILVSSRTQYFRKLRDERNHLTGGERGNKDEDSFQALLLLPFDDDQVRRYLMHFMPDADAGRIEDLLHGVNNLKELAHRPYTLSFVAKQLPSIEQARAKGRTVNGATLYREMARRWLDRDAYKHHIEPRDKLSLAAHLAAHLWKTRSSSMPVDELEEWFHDWLEAQPKVHRLYRDLHHSLLEEDLRNTTFLSRIDQSANESSYRFAHTSLQEFFLAEFLVDAVRNDEPQRWEGEASQGDILCPSRETLDFMGQILAEGDARGLLDVLERWVRTASTLVNTTVLYYTLRALSQGYPAPRLEGIRLQGAELANLHVPRTLALDLTGADLSGANLREARIGGCRLRNAGLAGADLTRAQVLDCELEAAELNGAKLVGTVFRQTGFADVDDAVAPELYRTQFIRCREMPRLLEQSRDSLVAPLLEGDERRQSLAATAWLRSAVGYVGPVWSVAFSPDGATLASAGADGTIRLWDTKTATCTTILEGHNGGVKSVAFSPDGATLASAGDDGIVRLWDTRTATYTATLEGHKGMTHLLAFSPDGATLASAGDDGTIRLWDTQSGECWRIEMLSTQQYAVWNTDGTLRFASEDAWEYLGWQVPGGEGETATLLPAETFGPLPLPPGDRA
ncbi:MAG: pentapeptide repeat-containing protein [Coriobacteriales bacterium]|jgi:nucleoside phosphorylase/uncharacterized protein YjbI with pentapeptide repeats|nr:pentapeptide repeat-containing protein [Coriobacteriales bacterium]